MTGQDANCPSPAQRFLERVRAVARDCGYAVGVHGSEARDLDLIAVPWTPEAVSAQQLVDTLCAVVPLHARDQNLYGDEYPWRMEPNPEMKPWGRLAWSLDGVPGHAPWKYVDLSVAPRAGEAVPVFIAQGYRTAEREYLKRAEGRVSGVARSGELASRLLGLLLSRLFGAEMVCPEAAGRAVTAHIEFVTTCVADAESGSPRNAPGVALPPAAPGLSSREARP